MARRRMRSGFDTVRDALLFAVGVALGGWAVTRNPPDAGLLTIAAGLCIAPATLLPRAGKGDPE